MDKQDTEGSPLISGPLKIIQNPPLITVENWVMEGGSESKWDFEAAYSSIDRGLDIGETYKKGYPDIIKNEKVIKFEKKETISGGSPIGTSDGAAASSCPLQGVIENKKHKQVITVYPWLPYIGQLVICLYLPKDLSNN